MTEKLRSLIREGRDIDRQHKQLGDELKTIRTTLLSALDAGKHAGTCGAVATIIHPAAKLEAVEDLAAARELLAQLPALRHVAGDGQETQGADALLERIFVRQTVYRPAKGFREIVRTILPADVAEQLIALVEEPSAPQCRFA